MLVCAFFVLGNDQNHEFIQLTSSICLGKKSDTAYVSVPQDSIIIHKRLHKHKAQYEIITTHIWNVDSLYFVWQWSTLAILLQWWNRSRWCNIWLFNVFPIVFGQQCSLARMLKLLFTGWYIRQNLDTVLKWCFCNSYSSFDKRYITSLCFVFLMNLLTLLSCTLLTHCCIYNYGTQIL